MSALENLTKTNLSTGGGGGGGGSGGSGGAAAPPAPRVVAQQVDPLKKYRNMLSAGSVMTVWTKGVGRPCHVLASGDMRSIVWQDPKSKKKLGAMDLRVVHDIQLGMGPGHKKKMLGRKKCNPDCAFSIVGDHHSLNLETSVPAQTKTWTTALTALLTTFKTNPSAL